MVTKAPQTAVLVLGGCTVDLVRRRVERGKDVVRLTRLEAALLGYLCKHSGRDVPRDELLEKVWGYRISVVTRAVDNTVSRLRRKIEQDPRNPMHLLKSHGMGYRLVTSPERKAPAGPATRILGDTGTRTVERKTLADRVGQGGGLVTVFGPAGIGKTWLVQRLLADVSPGTATLCDLVPATGPLDLLRVIASALDMPLVVSAEVDEATALVGTRLGEKGSCVVILDSAEHLVKPLSGLLSRWLDAAPDTLFVVTSQVALGLQMEEVFGLGPLSATAARSLFLERAARWGNAEDDADAVDALVERLEGLPLAIELAAGRTGVLTAAQILKRLDDPLRLLQSAGRDDASHSGSKSHNSLRAAISWSWGLLTEDERTALARCSILVDGFDVETFEAVVEHPDALDMLDNLQARGMLQRFEVDGTRRLRMAEPLRAFASEKCDQPLEASARQCLVRHAMVLAEGLDAALKGPDAGAALDRLDGERSLWLEVLSEPDVTTAQRRLLWGLLHRLFDLRGPAVEFRAVIEATLLGTKDAAFRSELLLSRSILRRRALNWEGAIRDLADARERVKTLGDVPLEVLVLVNLSQAAIGMGDSQAALASAEAANDLAASGDDDWARALAWRAEAQVIFRLGLPGDPRPPLEKALRVMEERGEKILHARTLILLGGICVQEGDETGARKAFDKALEFCREVGDPLSESRLDGSLAYIHLLAGRLELAAEHARDALKGCRLLGDRLNERIHVYNLALIEIEQGQPNQALQVLSSQPGGSDGNRRFAGLMAMARGQALVLLGQLDAAGTAFEAAEGYLEAETDSLAWCMLHRAMVQHANGATDAARRAIATAPFLDPEDSSLQMACDLVQDWHDGRTPAPADGREDQALRLVRISLAALRNA